MSNIKYDPSKLEDNPAFDGVRTLLSRPLLEPIDYLNYFSEVSSDINTLLKPMYELAKSVSAKTIVELGTRWGNSTIALLIYCHYNNKELNTHLYSVDIEDCHVAISIIKALGLERYWTFTQINDMEYIKEWRDNKGNKGIDLLFIDTDHTYELTRKELELYSPYVNIGGVILFHDSTTEGVKMGWEEFLIDHKNWISIDDDKFMPLTGKVIKRII